MTEKILDRMKKGFPKRTWISSVVIQIMNATQTPEHAATCLGNAEDTVNMYRDKRTIDLNEAQYLLEMIDAAKKLLLKETP